MEPNPEQALAGALDRLWKQFLPDIEQRVARLEAANQALGAGDLSDRLRAEANSAAHKLAGTLGTFGLTRGTILAREAELLYSGGETDPEALPQLKAITEQLKTLIASRK
jgi:HPt (histidine-containing phosphotransfer) domain-containing protein